MAQQIYFRLVQDENGCPPAAVEGVWATPLESGNLFVIDNIPFFAREATLGDTVKVLIEDGVPFYRSTQVHSGNSLIRVVLLDSVDAATLRHQLIQLGCSSELSHIPSLVAVNVPPNVNLDEVRRFLDQGLGQGLWDYEEVLVYD